jgi:protoheme IX farnesyltransferase
MANIDTYILSRPAATVGDFFALLKPRVMSLVLFTALAGMVAAPGAAHIMTAFCGLLCIAIGAGASGALNMAYDADIDRLMSRTAARPIPVGRIAREDALAFGWTLAVASVTMMLLFVNALSAALLAFTIFFYIGIYTLLLKRNTPQNIVIGGLAGALPPAIGWAVVTGTVSWQPMLLVAIIFLWTPPHFWALSLFSSGDYARAGVPMLPVVRGKRSTRLHILAYVFLLVPFGLAPSAFGMAGPIYLAAAVVMGSLLLWKTEPVMREHDEVREPAARKLFTVTIFYLFSLFAALIVEHLGGIAPLHAWI